MISIPQISSLAARMLSLPISITSDLCWYTTCADNISILSFCFTVRAESEDEKEAYIQLVQPACKKDNGKGGTPPNERRLQVRRRRS